MTRAYIAGFLDGDGSIFLQLIRRKDYKFGYQIRASIVFYQHNSNKKILKWLKHKLRIGYLRDRKDGMTEYTIVGLEEVKRVIILTKPYVFLKRKQAELALRIIKRLERGNISAGMFLRIAKEVDKFKILNYSKKRTNTSLKVRKYFITHHLLSP
ncbi:LAGLIDADG family homing endonuclease [Candidatus Microgenomates bacterium]|nr:LAGLIDADG family homing endonuclease [Candidatus Microgenomates bacterium]